MTKTYVDEPGEYLATPLPDGKTARGEADDSMRALVLAAAVAFVGGMAAVLVWAVLR
mgnify:CR=1 FL=1